MRLITAILAICAAAYGQPARSKRVAPVPASDVAGFENQGKVAILVGVGGYPARGGLSQLRYPAGDVDALTAVLEGQGYSVVPLKESEATRAGIQRAIRNAGEVLDQNGTVVFFFSGHGFAVGNRNYLATYESSAIDLSRTGLALDDVEAALKETGAARRMLWIDACRNEPGKAATAPRSFAAFQAAAGTRILFSTRAGKVSYENDDLRSGVFTHFLIEGLQGGAAGSDGQVTFRDLSEYVTASVRDYGLKRGDVQVPYDAGEAAGDFLIARKAGAAPESHDPGVRQSGAPGRQSMFEEGVRSRAAGKPGEALDWFRKGAAAGELRSMVEMGKAYIAGVDLARDPDEALRWFRQAAEAGDADGMAQLGDMYRNGWGAAKDDDAALQWFRKSANAGSGDGMARLGEMYRLGQGVTRDDEEALKWFRKAANADSGLGMDDLGNYYESAAVKDPDEAVRWYKKAVNAGSPDGMVDMAEAYSSGQGIAKDEAEALRLVRKAVDLGSLRAMNELGIFYGAEPEFRRTRPRPCVGIEGPRMPATCTR